MGDRLVTGHLDKYEGRIIVTGRYTPTALTEVHGFQIVNTAGGGRPILAPSGVCVHAAADPIRGDRGFAVIAREYPTEPDWKAADFLNIVGLYVDCVPNVAGLHELRWFRSNDSLALIGEYTRGELAEMGVATTGGMWDAVYIIDPLYEPDVFPDTFPDPAAPWVWDTEPEPAGEIVTPRTGSITVNGQGPYTVLAVTRTSDLVDLRVAPQGTAPPIGGPLHRTIRRIAANWATRLADTLAARLNRDPAR